MKTKSILKIVIITLCVSIFISFFLPFCSAKGSHLDFLERNESKKIYYDLDMNYGDLINMSTFKHLKVMGYGLEKASEASSNYGMNVDSSEESFCVVIIVLFIISLILLLIFEILNKRVLSIIFNALFLLNSLLLYGLFILDNNNYGASFSSYYYLIAGFAILGCTIVLIVLNKKEKKNKKNTLEDSNKDNKKNLKNRDKIAQKSELITIIGTIIMMVGCIFPLPLYDYEVSSRLSFSYKETGIRVFLLIVSLIIFFLIKKKHKIISIILLLFSLIVVFSTYNSVSSSSVVYSSSMAFPSILIIIGIVVTSFGLLFFKKEKKNIVKKYETIN